jgi:hypothetical protein
MVLTKNSMILLISLNFMRLKEEAFCASYNSISWFSQINLIYSWKHMERKGTCQPPAIELKQFTLVE